MNQMYFCFLIFVLASLQSGAQDKWDLRKCVDYAIANNISVKLADLQVRFSELGYKLDKGTRYPSLNGGFNAGYSSGLSENPTTGTLENRKIFSITPGVQSGVTLFNWFSVRDAIESSRLAVEADKAQVTKVQNDIALNVAVGYLRALVARQQANVLEVQVKQTLTQLDFTRRQVRAGKLPELNAAELEAQVATDSSNLISAQTSAQQSILLLKVLLNLDAAAPFDVEVPPVELIPVESIAELQPDYVYQLAVMNLPQQRVNELRIQSAQKTVSSNRGRLFPSISAFGSLNTRYVAYRLPTYSQVVSGYQPTPFRVTTGSNTYVAESPVVVQGPRVGFVKSDPFGSQFTENFGQGIGIGVQVPIFNGNRGRINVNRAQLAVQQLQLQNDQDKQALKRDIYTAYSNAVSSMEKFNASRKAVSTAEKAFGFAQKRYDVGLLTTLELITAQARLTRTSLEMVSAQFDYVFRMKLLEFYKGQGLKL